jgi:hypothetical protein
MGFEMIKDKLAITPHRLYAMVRLASGATGAGRDEFLGLLQPSAVNDNHETGYLVYRYARRYGLLEEEQNVAKRVRPTADCLSLTSLDAFRFYMQKVLLGVTSDAQDNFLLSLFTAWYAVQDHSVMTYSKADFEAKFHQALYPKATERVLAEEPGISAWRTWAEFLGWGWALKLDGREEMRIVPDATLRLRPLLAGLLSEAGREVAMGDFMTGLAERCPELDGGVLFERCWEASRGGEVRGNRLSLMLSTALRVLHSSGEIEMAYRRDAGVTWTLFPAQSHTPQVTHIARKEAR